jgi:hypothetical protein
MQVDCILFLTQTVVCVKVLGFIYDPLIFLSQLEAVAQHDFGLKPAPRFLMFPEWEFTNVVGH